MPLPRPTPLGSAWGGGSRLSSPRAMLYPSGPNCYPLLLPKEAHLATPGDQWCLQVTLLGHQASLGRTQQKPGNLGPP